MLLSNKHIFIVEDNAVNAGIILTILQMQGATTHFDRWGTHTVHRLKDLPKVDLILMDLMLPNKVSGYDVYDQIKTIPALADIPVVIVSASDATAEMNKAREKGFRGYISKPIDFTTFAKAIAYVLEGNVFWAEDDF
jgi:CheY-like chemotaxis protein